MRHQDIGYIHVDASRRLYGGETELPAFDLEGSCEHALSAKAACCNADSAQVAIFDATNSTEKRRQLLVGTLLELSLLSA